MAVNFPDKIKHNNPALKIVDAADVDGLAEMVQEYAPATGAAQLSSAAAWAKARITTRADGTTIADNILDQYTGEAIQAKETTEITSDDSVDNIIYFKKGSIYYKRNFTFIRPEWFGAVADGVTENSAAFNLCFQVSIAQRVNVILSPGIYKFLSRISYASTYWSCNYVIGQSTGPETRNKGTIFDFTSLVDSSNLGILVTGSPGTPSEGAFKNISFRGATNTTIIQISGICGFKLQKCRFGQCNVGVNYFNRVAGEYTEYSILEDCTFINACTTAVKYTISSGADASFHASGLGKGCHIDTDALSVVPKVIIEAGARPYNAPLNVRCWYHLAGQILVENRSGRTVNFFGNITVEGFTGTGFSDADKTFKLFNETSVGSMYFSGSINSLTAYRLGDVKWSSGAVLNSPSPNSGGISLTDPTYFTQTQTAFQSGDIIKNLSIDHYGFYEIETLIHYKDSNRYRFYTALNRIFPRSLPAYYVNQYAASTSKIENIEVNDMTFPFVGNPPKFYLDGNNNYSVVFPSLTTNYLRLTAKLSSSGSIVDSFLVPFITETYVNLLNKYDFSDGSLGNWTSGSAIGSNTSNKISGITVLNLTGANNYEKKLFPVLNRFGKNRLFIRMYVNTSNTSYQTKIGISYYGSGGQSQGWTLPKIINGGLDWQLVSFTIDITTPIDEIFAFLALSGTGTVGYSQIFKPQYLWMEKDTSLFTMTSVLQRPTLNLIDTSSLPSNNLFVFEDNYQLIYDGVGTSPGTYKITAVGTNVTVGSFTNNGNSVGLNSLSGITGSSASIAITITGTRSDGNVFTLTTSQTINVVSSIVYVNSDQSVIDRKLGNILNSKVVNISLNNPGIIGVDVSNDNLSFINKYSSANSETTKAYTIDNSIVNVSNTSIIRTKQFNVNGKIN